MIMTTQKIIQDQKGAVALITVILLMFIFMVVTLGFLRMAISEQRQASDADLNARAYYAVESGIEDARRILNRFNSDGVITATELSRLRGGECARAGVDDAPVDPVLSEELSTEITCQLIDLEPGDYLASLGVNQAVFLPLIPAEEDEGPGAVTSVQIEWHEGSDVVARSSANSDLPEINCWSTDEDDCSGTPYPAMLRVGLFRHPVAGVNRGNIDNKISYLNPVNGVGNVTLSNFEQKAAGAVNQLSNAPKCDPVEGGAYFCTLTITAISGRVNYLRITPIYTGTDLRVRMFDSNGNALSFKGTQAKIDVTARAGDVIRRIETRIPLGAADILPDEAITTADELCKLISITSPNSAIDGCRD